MLRPAAFDTRQWLRFVLAGLLNTALSYGFYLLMVRYMGYQLAYLLAYALGVILAYVLNAGYVFRISCSWRGLLSYPVVYIVQYILAAILLEAAVNWVGLKQAVAPLPVMVCMVPLSYLVNKFVLHWPLQRRAS